MAACPKVALGLRASVEFGALIRKVVVSGRALSLCRPLPGSCRRDATVREVRGSFERFSSIAGALEAGTRERLARCYITVTTCVVGSIVLEHIAHVSSVAVRVLVFQAY
jgi:hypothetical protein